MTAKKRLEALEGAHDKPEEDPKAAEKRLQDIREQALHTNRCQARGEPPLFVVNDDSVFCASDGKPVTDDRQILAEKSYWMEVGWAGPGLVHNQEEEAFYTPEGELALSRDFVHLERLMGNRRMERWEAEGEY